MKETLSYLEVKLCEKLPLDFTLFEEDGFCTKPDCGCHYARERKNTDDIFCHKKTYTRLPEPLAVP